MWLSFEHTVSALCYSIVGTYDTLGAADRARVSNLATRFVLRQHQKMPDLLRPAMTILTLVFDAAAVLRWGRPFHTLSPSNRWSQIEQWRRSRLGPMSDLVRFYESLAVFALVADAHE